MNCFQHQIYPTEPQVAVQRVMLSSRDLTGTDFSALHTALGVSRVLLVHGTFMGDDPFGIGDVLRLIAEKVPLISGQLQDLAETVVSKSRPFITSLTDDIGNYTEGYRDAFQQIVGPDPHVELLNPTWSGQNHHFARADLAVRLFQWLLNQSFHADERVLLWGHSHAGNAFALLSNLMANDRVSVEQFFAASNHPADSHWIQVRSELASTTGPHPLAGRILIAAFGTPVRYAWDTRGLKSLVHVLHDVPHSGEFESISAEVLRTDLQDRPSATDSEVLEATQTQPLFPPQPLPHVINAKYGDWVQAFAVAETDSISIPHLESNRQLSELLQRNLMQHEAEIEASESSIPWKLRLVPAGRLRRLCRRWMTGTRFHTSGLNIAVQYEPSGQRAHGLPLEHTIMGHGVATTIEWLPAHLRLVADALAIQNR
ncbi:MAG: hypothetical protein R3C20_06125 [Planctomycetaceae bacterium]